MIKTSIDKRQSLESQTADAAIVAAESVRGGHLIVRCTNREAHRHGIRNGMPVLLAHAIVPSLWTVPYSIEDDIRALYKTAEWLYRFSPLITLEPQLISSLKRPDSSYSPSLLNGIILNIGGTEKLHQSEELLIEKIDRFFLSRSIHARYGIALSASLASALARYGKEKVTILDRAQPVKRFISPLSINALLPTKELKKRFYELGINTIGQLLSFRSSQLARQFGILTAQRIDYLLGVIPEKISYINIPEKYLTSKCFFTPLKSLKQIQHATRELFEQLFERLARARLSCDHFELYYRAAHIMTSFNSRERQAIYRRDLTLFSGCTKQLQLLQILTPWLEKLSIASGIDKIVVHAPHPMPLHYTQGTLTGIGSERNIISLTEIEELLTQWSARFGTDRIQSAQIRESHQIEESFSFESLKSKSQEPISLFRSLLPAKLLSPPQEIHVISLLPDHTPKQILWLGRKILVIKYTAHEKILDQWHHQLYQGGTVKHRIYFSVQEPNGTWLLIYRESHTRRWFVQGIWL
jgi:protein ImuB